MRLHAPDKSEAEGFYAVHRARPFFASLTDFMSSGPCVVLALEAPDAIKKWRTLMGATDPAKADAGTLRKEFGESIENNATHGSDAPETAAFELGYFFRGIELRGSRAPGGMGHSLAHRSASDHRRPRAADDGGRAARAAAGRHRRSGGAHVTFYFPIVTSIRAEPADHADAVVRRWRPSTPRGRRQPSR